MDNTRAFPGFRDTLGYGECIPIPSANGNNCVNLNQGMDLRDYFAIRLLPDILNEMDKSEPYKLNAAIAAYELADIMMEARNFVKTQKDI